MAFEDLGLDSGMDFDPTALLSERLKRKKELESQMQQQGANPIADLLLGLGGGVVGGITGQNGQAVAQGAINAFEKGATGNTAKRLKALDSDLPEIKLLTDYQKARQGLAQRYAGLDTREAQSQTREAQAEVKRLEKKNQEMEKGQEKAGKALEPVESMLAGVGDVEGLLKKSKVDLDSYVPGTAVDLPGFHLPLIGPVTAFSPEARTLDDTFKGVFNTLLKERSGAAVTDSELKRLAQEFSQGRFNTEEEKVGALQRLKKGLLRQRARTEGRYAPEVIQSLRGRQEQAAQGIPLLQQPGQPQAQQQPQGAKFQTGEIREKNGKLYQRQADGTWLPTQ